MRFGKKRFSVLPTMLLFFALSFFIQTEPVLAGGGTFTGTWSAAGERQSIDFPEDRKVFTFKLSGHVNLRNPMVRSGDYWAECIGLWDLKTGGSARCVWRDLDGTDKAYLVLNGRMLEKDAVLEGEFVGGAGALEGLEGSVSLTWSSVSYNRDEGVVAGFAKKLEGQWRVP